ncbi:myosin-11-like [Artemia franciscana]
MEDEPIYSQPNSVLRKVPSLYLQKHEDRNSSKTLQDIINRQQHYIIHLERQIEQFRINGQSDRNKISTGTVCSNIQEEQSPTAPPKPKRQFSKRQFEDQYTGLERKMEEQEKINAQLQQKLEEKDKQLLDLKNADMCSCIKDSKTKDEAPILRQQESLVANFERLVSELQKKYDEEIKAYAAQIRELSLNVEDLTESNKILGDVLVKAKNKIKELGIQRRELQRESSRLKATSFVKERQLAEIQGKLENVIDWSQKLKKERDCLKGIARERARSETQLIQKCAAEAVTVAKLKQKLKYVYNN